MSSRGDHHLEVLKLAIVALNDLATSGTDFLMFLAPYSNGADKGQWSILTNYTSGPKSF